MLALTTLGPLAMTCMVIRQLERELLPVAELPAVVFRSQNRRLVILKIK